MITIGVNAKFKQSKASLDKGSGLLNKQIYILHCYVNYTISFSYLLRPLLHRSFMRCYTS